MSLTFQAAASFAAGTSPQSVLVADVNGDGVLDIVVADSSGGVEVLYGGSTGFAPAITYAAGTSPYSVAVADVNADGHPDLVVADISGGVNVLIGTPGGTSSFSTPFSFAAGANPKSVALADLNGDGIPDAVVADLNGGVDVLLGVAGGGFSAPVSLAAGTSPYAVAVADLNGDGRPDLIVANAGGGVDILLANPAGGYLSAVSYAAGLSPRSLAVADLNGDGRPDLVVGDSQGGVEVLLNQGAGVFGPATSYAAGANPSSVAVADVNGDGIADVVVADSGANTVSVLLGTGSGTFAAPVTFATSGAPQAVSVADLNGDGHPDIVVATATGGVNILLGVACYCPGTAILTDRGEVAVERLAIGDLVVTLGGAIEPIRWIGRRSFGGRFLANKQHLLPVLFRAGSLGAGPLGEPLPTRDLRVSPEHAMFIDGVLVPARCLVNGTTIAQDRKLERVDYFHVELASHNVILADGAPSETFLDDGNRAMFHNFADFNVLYPDTQSAGAFYAPRVESGPALAAIRAKLDGAGVREVRLGSDGEHRVAIPAGVHAIRLLTGSGFASGDRRRLGAAISRVALDGQDIQLSDPRLAAGWYGSEGDWRWTDGAALVLVSGAKQLEIRLTALPFQAAA